MDETRRDVTAVQLDGNAVRFGSLAERGRAVGDGAKRDRSVLEVTGTPEGLLSLASALAAAAGRARESGEDVITLRAPDGAPGLSREWSAVTVRCRREALGEFTPALLVEVAERTSDAHRRDKLVIEVHNRLATAVRITGFHFETESMKSAGNADVMLHGGRGGRFSFFVPSDTKELELTVDGFTDLAGGGTPTRLGARDRSRPLPARATRSILEDRLM
jgi:hypothetical protein